MRIIKKGTEVEFYSINHIKNYCNIKGRSFSLEKFFEKPRMVFFRGGILYINEKDLRQYNMSEYSPIIAYKKDLSMVIDYQDFLDLNRKNKIEGIIKNREQAYEEGRYVENTIDHLRNAKKIVAIDCEFNRDEITEIGLFIIDIEKDTFDMIHYCKIKEDMDSISPFRNPYSLSLGNPYYVNDISEISDKVSLILSEADCIIGHAIKNDVDVLRKNGIKGMRKRAIVDTQKIFHKINNQLLSLSGAVDHYGSDFLDNVVSEESSLIVDEIKEEFEKTHPNFIKKNLYNKLFIHNALNDAVCTMFLLGQIYKKEHNFSLIDDILEKRIESQAKNNYSISLQKFIKYSKDKMEKINGQKVRKPKQW